MDSLRSLFRWMLAGWLVLLVIMSIAVARSTQSTGVGNLLAFLFTRPETATHLPPVEPAKPAPPPQPVITPPQVITPPPAPTSEWIALEQGKTPGKGRLGKPEIIVNESGEVEVRFALDGEVGKYRILHPTNVTALSVDLLGAWGNLFTDKHLAGGALSRVQIGTHAQWLRVSGIARDPAHRLAAGVEYSPKERILRVVFRVEE